MLVLVIFELIFIFTLLLLLLKCLYNHLISEMLWNSNIVFVYLNLTYPEERMVTFYSGAICAVC